MKFQLDFCILSLLPYPPAYDLLLQLHRCEPTNEREPSSVLLSWSDFSRLPCYSNNQHLGFPGESQLVFLILRLCAFCHDFRPPLGCLAAGSVAPADAFCVAACAAAVEQNVGVVGAGGCGPVSCVLMQTKSCFRDAWA